MEWKKIEKKVEDILFLPICNNNFHQLGPLGQVGVVVAMSMYWIGFNGIGETFRIGRDSRFLPYAGFL